MIRIRSRRVPLHLGLLAASPPGDVRDPVEISMRKGGSDGLVIFTTTGYPERSRHAKEVLEVAVSVQ